MAGLSVALDGLEVRHPAASAEAPAALHPLSLKIEAGEQVAVIGPSGAGKTTLLHAIACALRPSSGRLLLDAVDPWSLPVRLLQRLRGQRTVTALLAARLPVLSLWSSLRSLVYPSGAAQAHAALERFDLSDKLWTRVDRLSGGERQRVGLARALLAPAGLWLVDEPLSALDPTRSRMVIETLTGEARIRGVTLLATLHQVDVAIASFPRIIGLRNGELAFDLPSAEVTREHLLRLYAQFEHELAGAPPVPAEPPARAATVVVCR
jgi:phosphonate transport system ATP-binding protein